MGHEGTARVRFAAVGIKNIHKARKIMLGVQRESVEIDSEHEELRLSTMSRRGTDSTLQAGGVKSLAQPLDSVDSCTFLALHPGVMCCQ